MWDLRKQAVTYSLLGHTDTVTSLQMSPDNQTLLSNAHDSTVRTWDVRPFAPADRRLMTYDGAPTGQERNLLKASWDAKGEKIAAGSGDQSVAVWEVRTGKMLHKLPGHKGAVNDVRFHPHGEPICKSSRPSLTLSCLRMYHQCPPDNVTNILPYFTCRLGANLEIYSGYCIVGSHDRCWRARQVKDFVKQYS